MNKYETKVILEALNIALLTRTTAVIHAYCLPKKLTKLIFENEGGFIEGNAEDYTFGEKTPKKYRNRWLPMQW